MWACRTTGTIQPFGPDDGASALNYLTQAASSSAALTEMDYGSVASKPSSLALPSTLTLDRSPPLTYMATVGLASYECDGCGPFS